MESRAAQYANLPQDTMRIPSLDGLRAVSIGLVLIGHIALPYSTSSHQAVRRLAAAVNAGGTLGVTVFFGISGFLITSLLIDELERTGRISLRDFYLRRTFRIFPPFYAYIAVVLMLTAFGVIHPNISSVLSAITYTSNYCTRCTGPDVWYLGHSWSLAVEEQFYLLWPAVLMWGGRRGGRAVAISALILCPVLRTVTALYGANNGMRFELVADALAIGCVLAISRPALHANSHYMQFLRAPATACLPIAVVLGTSLQNFPSVLPTIFVPSILTTLLLLGITLTIDRVVTLPERGLGSLLNGKVLVWLGGLSYSLYLWQQMFLVPHGAGWWNEPLLGVTLAICTALFSQRLIERPALAMRNRFSKRQRLADAPA